MMLFAVTFGVPHLVLWGAVALAAVLLTMRLFQKDEQREDRDRERNAVVRLLEQAKLPRMADILECVVVRDWSGLLRECIALRKEAKTEADLLRLLEGNFTWQLEQRMKVEEQRDRIVQLVKDLADIEQAKANRAEQAIVDKLKAEGYTVTAPVSG